MLVITGYGIGGVERGMEWKVMNSGWNYYIDSILLPPFYYPASSL
jgi:hypothetical protein